MMTPYLGILDEADAVIGMKVKWRWGTDHIVLLEILEVVDDLMSLWCAAA